MPRRARVVRRDLLPDPKHGSVLVTKFINSVMRQGKRSVGERIVYNAVDILAEKGVHVAHTPKTYLKLAMEMPPLPRFLAGGVAVALGTDGPASNSDLNMLEVLRIAGLYHKHALGQPDALPRAHLLRLATQAGAWAMGFERSGALAPGRPADLILLDTRASHWFPRHDLAAGVVYAAHPSDVSHVIVDGRVILRDGELLTLDEDRIRYEDEQRAFRIVRTPMNQARAYQR